MTFPQVPGGQRMRGNEDLYREGMRGYRESADRQYESFRQEKARLEKLYQDVQQRKETLSGQLQRRIQSLGNPDSAKQFQTILDQLEQQFAQGQLNVVRTGNAGISAIQEAHTGFQLPAQEVFDRAIAAEQQAIVQLNGVVENFRARAVAKQQEFRDANARLRAETEQATANYESGLTSAMGGREVRTATTEIRAATAARKRAELQAAEAGLPELLAKKQKLERDRGTSPLMANLAAKKTALETAERTLKDTQDAKAKAEALPAEVQKLEEDLAKATEAKSAAQKVVEGKQLDAAAAGVKADYLTRPKALEAVTACNTDAEAAKTAVPAGPGRDAEVARIEAKRVKDVQIIRDFFTAQDLVKAEQTKETAARTALNGVKTKLAAEETALGLPPAAPTMPLRARVEAITKAYEKKVKDAEKAVTDLEEEVTKLEEEIEEKFLNPLQDLEDQIKPLQEPLDAAIAAEKAAKAKAGRIKTAKKSETPDANQQAEFVKGARGLLTQINREGTYMRQHFSGEQPVEQRTIDLVKRRTDVAADIAERTKEEKDVRSALDYAREELRWLKRNADQHEARIAELLPLVQQLGEKYCEALRKKTEASGGKPLAERWQPIQQEIMALQEYMPVTGKARIDALQAKAKELVTLQHAELRRETDDAILSCRGMDVPEETMSTALSLLRKEGNFIRKYRGPEERFAYLQEEYGKIGQQLAARRGQTLRREATDLTAGPKNREGRMQAVEDLISTEKRLGEGVNPLARADVEELKREQLTELAKETDAVLKAAINSPDRATKLNALNALLEEAVLLQTHFQPTSAERIVQLRNAATQLLNDVANGTQIALDQCNTDGATVPHFREAFRMLAEERSFLQKNRAFQTIAAARLAELEQKEIALDTRMMEHANTVVAKAVSVQTVENLDTAQAFTQLMIERAPLVSPARKIVFTAALEKLQASLKTIRGVRAEERGLEQARTEVEVQGKIDPIRERLERVKIESPTTWEESGTRMKMLAQLRQDIKTLNDSLPLATNRQKIAMQTLIADIEKTIWEKLQNSNERKQIFLKNLPLMAQEAQATALSLREPVTPPTLAEHERRIAGAQNVLMKAQGYVDVAPDYSVTPAQLDPLKKAMATLTAEITTMQKVVETYRRKEGIS